MKNAILSTTILCFIFPHGTFASSSSLAQSPISFPSNSPNSILLQDSSPIEQPYLRIIHRCAPLQPRPFPPANVTDLRPDDIQLILALGDSATAGFGAKNSIWDNLFQENRGVSYSNGGDNDAISLANFFQHYSPYLDGSSFGRHLVSICGRSFCVPSLARYYPTLDRYNAALSGATVHELKLELDYLVPKLIKEGNRNKEWKFLNIFIGANDVCKACSKETDSTEYEILLDAAIQRIKRDIPYTIVNLLQLPKVTGLKDVPSRFPNKCGNRGWLIKFGCPCAFENDRVRARMDQLIDEYNQKMLDIAARYNSGYTSFSSVPPEQQIYYGDSPTFTVIVSPELKDDVVKDEKMLSYIDCFHPSVDAHEITAMSIWEGLFVPFAERSTTLSANSTYCPTEYDRIMTN